MTVFLAEPTCDMLDAIADVECGGKVEGIKIHDTHTINACNHIHSGTIDVDGVIHAFIIESGDNRGTVVLEWGDPEKIGSYDPGPPPEPITFIPVDAERLLDEHPAKFGIYLYWRKQTWFMEKERGLNYDRHFAPGLVTNKYYDDWAKKSWMKTGYLSSIQTLIDRYNTLNKG